MLLSPRRWNQNWSPFALAALAAVLIVPSVAAARPQIPIIRQITRATTGDIQNVGMRLEDASGISFVSNGDVFGPGSAPGQYEVFFYDVLTDELIQVTDTPGGESYEVSRPTDRVRSQGRPSLIAFVSTGDFDPDRDNSDGNPEIFAWETDTGLFRQLTDTQPPVVNLHPFPSDSFKCMVFSSTGDLNNNDGSDSSNPGRLYSNVDNSLEVFQYNVHREGMYPYTGVMSQLSNGPTGTFSATPVTGGYWFPRQCQSTAYVSNFDQLGEGTNGEQIYVFSRYNGNLERMQTTRKLPLGIPDGEYRYPHISAASPFARGPYVVFSTEADIWNNNSRGLNLFRYRVFHPQLIQLTDLDEGNVSFPQVSDGGGRIVFQSTGDHIIKIAKPKTAQLPLNADGNNEIFVLRGRRRIRQITVTEGCNNTRPTLKDDATAFAFTSDCELIPGLNPDGAEQVYHYFQVKRDDPILAPGACRVEDGCCSESNGCLVLHQGLQKRASKRYCLDKGPEKCEE